jgi:hypothetical protein
LDNGQDLKIQPAIDDDDDDDSFGDTAQDLPLDSEDVTLAELGNSSTKTGLTYQFVAKKATNLVRLAQTDQVKLGSLYILLDQLTNRLWKGHSIEVAAFDTAMPLGKENVGAKPVLGTLKPAPNTYNQRQMVSRHETRQRLASKRRNPLLSLVTCWHWIVNATRR